MSETETDVGMKRNCQTGKGRTERGGAEMFNLYQ